MPFAGSAQKSDFSYLLEKESKDKLRDGHLWLSVLTRPLHSSFTRTDRLTCCFVLLYMSMLMNIVYYGVQSDTSSLGGLKIGPFNLKIEQVNLNS